MAENDWKDRPDGPGWWWVVWPYCEIPEDREPVAVRLAERAAPWGGLTLAWPREEFHETESGLEVALWLRMSPPPPTPSP